MSTITAELVQNTKKFANIPGNSTSVSSAIKTAIEKYDAATKALDEAKNATAVDLNFLIGVDDYDFEDCAYTSVAITHPLTDLVGSKMDFAVSVFSIS